jgi:calcium permeable stress-gated cation channel
LVGLFHLFLILAYISGLVLFVIGRETLFLIKVRQAYLLSTWNASRISQRTILYTNVPKDFLSHSRIYEIFSGVSQIWFVSNTSDLDDDVDELDDTALKLEKAELELISKTNKAYRKKKRKDRGTEEGQGGHKKPIQHTEYEMRSKHRLKFLIGHKVDTIEHSRQRLTELIPKISSAQKSHLNGEEKLLGAIFIEFESLSAAQAAFAMTAHNTPGKFVTRQMGILPDEIIWNNLKMNSWDRSARHAIATAFIAALILFWSIPVALVGIISNVNYLTENVSFLAWIDDIPSVILGVVTGLLPTVLLAALMALVPIICRSKLRFLKTLWRVDINLFSRREACWRCIALRGGATNPSVSLDYL